MSSRKSRLAMMMVGLALLSASILPAQMEISPYLTVHYDEIRPEQSNAYEANGKAWVDAFEAAGIGPEYGWDGYNADFTYAWVSDMPNWAYLDTAEARQKSVVDTLGEEKFAALMEGANSAVARHHTEVLKFEPEMSYMPEGFNPMGMGAINVGTQYVKPARSAAFQAMVKEVVAAMKKVEAPIHFLTYSVAFGEGSYAFVSWGEDRAALHAGPQMGALLAQALGPEEAQAMFQNWTETIDKVVDKDWRVRPDLTYRPGRGMEEAAE